MPLYYDNTMSPYISRTDRIFAEPQEWSINLADQVVSTCVDLKHIKQLSIGIGAPQATSPGGRGLVYIDDIRLYQPKPNRSK